MVEFMKNGCEFSVLEVTDEVESREDDYLFGRPELMQILPLDLLLLSGGDDDVCENQYCAQ